LNKPVNTHAAGKQGTSSLRKLVTSVKK